MVRPNKKQLEKLKQQDKAISALEKKKKYVEKDENILKRLITPTPIEIDLKKLKDNFRKKKR